MYLNNRNSSYKSIIYNILLKNSVGFSLCTVIFTYLLLTIYYLIDTLFITDKVNFGILTGYKFNELKTSALCNIFYPLFFYIYYILWMMFLYLLTGIDEQSCDGKRISFFIRFLCLLMMDTKMFIFKMTVYNYLVNPDLKYGHRFIPLIFIVLIILLVYKFNFLIIISPYIAIVAFYVFDSIPHTNFLENLDENYKIPFRLQRFQDYDYNKTINDFCLKYNFDRKYISLIDQEVPIASVVTYFNAFSFKLVNIIFLNIDCIFQGKDAANFILKHEYGHIIRNSYIKVLLITLLKCVVMCVYILFDYCYDGFNVVFHQYNTLEADLRFIKSNLKATAWGLMLDIPIMLYSRMDEHRCDDFAVDTINKSSELLANTKENMKYYLNDSQQSHYVLHPTYFPLFSHPSIYHRFERQILRLAHRFNN